MASDAFPVDFGQKERRGRDAPVILGLGCRHRPVQHEPGSGLVGVLHNASVDGRILNSAHAPQGDSDMRVCMGLTRRVAGCPLLEKR